MTPEQKPDEFGIAMPSRGHRARFGGRHVLFAGVAGACLLGAGLGFWARPAISERRAAASQPPEVVAKAATPARTLQIVVDDRPRPAGAPIEVLPASTAKPGLAAPPVRAAEPPPQAAPMAPAPSPRGLLRIRDVFAPVAPPEPQPEPQPKAASAPPKPLIPPSIARLIAAALTPPKPVQRIEPVEPPAVHMAKAAPKASPRADLHKAELARAAVAHRAQLAQAAARKAQLAQAAAHRIELARAAEVQKQARKLEQVRLAKAAKAQKLEQQRLAQATAKAEKQQQLRLALASKAQKQELLRLAKAEARGRAEALAEARAQAKAEARVEALAEARADARKRMRLASLAHALQHALQHRIQAHSPPPVELAKADRTHGKRLRHQPQVERASMRTRRPPRMVEQPAPPPRASGLMRVSAPRCANRDPGQALVCADPSLGAAERQLSRAYQGARAAGVPDAQLQSQQQRWLSARSAAAREAPWAVHDVYLARIAELNGQAKDAHGGGY